MKALLRLICTLILTHTSSASCENYFNVNDVSFLWPAPLTTTQVNGRIPLSAIVPSSLFDGIIANSNFEINEFADINNWRISSIRVDPCGHDENISPDFRECNQEIRFVAQGVRVLEKNGTVIFSDLTMHIIFNIGMGSFEKAITFKELLSKLTSFKEDNLKNGIDTQNLELGVHPALANSNNTAQKLADIIKSTLPKGFLKKVTFIGAMNSEGPWIAFEGDIINNDFKLLKMKSYKNALKAEFRIDNLNKNFFSIYPAPVNIGWPFAEDNVLGPSILQAMMADKAQLTEKAIIGDGVTSNVLSISDIIPAINNPKIAHRGNVDCFSCHTTSAPAERLGLKEEDSLFSFKANALDANTEKKYVITKLSNLRMFGWFGSLPSVSPRVVNESAESVILINKYLEKL